VRDEYDWKEITIEIWKGTFFSTASSIHVKVGCVSGKCSSMARNSHCLLRAFWFYNRTVLQLQADTVLCVHNQTLFVQQFYQQVYLSNNKCLM
jgi:hypothetical protein